MRTISLILLLLLANLPGCRTGEQPEPAQYRVPTSIEPYVEAFRYEMRIRNHAVPTDNLIITFDAVQGEDVCGQCILESGKTPRITINPDAYCWQNASDNERECLIFHELGHCLLARSHRTERFPNKAYRSLMNPDDTGIYATCRYPIGDDVCDKRSRRSYYVDELFDPATLAPVWGK